MSFLDERLMKVIMNYLKNKITLFSLIEPQYRYPDRKFLFKRPRIALGQL